MAAQVLSVDREFRYIIMWFNEWSELQREDFIPILVEYLTQSSSCGSNGIYMNGLVNAVSNVDISTNKPMSLFQCRIKLFREWSCKWPLDFKQKLQEKIFEIDGKVGERVIDELKTYNDTHSNDNAGSGESVTVNDRTVTAAVTDDIVNAAVAIVNETEEAIISDNRLAAVLNNETSVDADDDDGNDNEIDNGNNEQENTAHVIELAGQVQAQPEHAIVSSPQTVLNTSAEVPLVA